jgi:hypothetical protein
MRVAAAILALACSSAWAALPGPYSPPAGQPGSTAVPYYSASGTDHYDARIRGWASEVTQLVRGPENIAVTGSQPVAWGEPGQALGPADAYGSQNFNVISLGDGGSITLKFPQSIGDGPGPDLAVFENAFSDTFLELAFVEVSTNGTKFYRLPAVSLTQTNTQVGGFGELDTTYLHNLAGKYRSGFGTPFDLADLAGIDDVEFDVHHINYVRVVDVVGSIDPLYGTRDSQGHLVNDPWSTEWESGGFDLDAVAYLNIPEPAAPLLCFAAISMAGLLRRRA